MTLMAQEIAESGEAAARCLAQNDFAALAERLRRLDPAVVVTNARGSSDHCALYLKYAVEIALGLPCASIGPSIASLYHAPMRLTRAVAVSISQSGRSPDILAGQAAAKAGGALTVALVNDASSPLAMQAEALLPLAAGEERSVAATKSVIAALTASAALVAAWGNDDALSDALARLPLALAPPAPPPQALVDAIVRAESAFVLGRGSTYAVACEAALKLKETCALHAEAFSAAEVMHGPAEIVKPGFLVLAFPPRDEGAEGFSAALARFAALGRAGDRRGGGGARRRRQVGRLRRGPSAAGADCDDPQVLRLKRGGGAGARTRSRPAKPSGQGDGDALMRIFVGARLFDGFGWRDDCALVTQGGEITALVPYAERPSGETVDLRGGVLAPGFIDWQVNGGGGLLFNDAPTPETIRGIAAAHRRFGTTALAPTVITDAPEVLEAALGGRAAGDRGVAGRACRGAVHRPPPQRRASARALFGA